MERETRLELATPTLAMILSTNDACRSISEFSYSGLFPNPLQSSATSSLWVRVT